MIFVDRDNPKAIPSEKRVVITSHNAEYLAKIPSIRDGFEIGKVREIRL